MNLKISIIKDDLDFKELLPVVATKEFLSSKSNEYGWFIDENFILSYIIEKKFIFRRLIFTYNVIKKKNNSLSQKEFLNNVVKLSKTLNIDFIYQPYAFAIFEDIPDNCISIPFGSYKVDLTLSEDELFKNLHSKHRNVVRKAMKSELEIFQGEKYKLECFNLIKDTLERQQQPYISLKAVNTMYENFGNNIAFYIIKNEDKIEGSAIILFNEYEAYYLLAGSAIKTSAGAMNLLVWQIMLDMKGKGVNSFDFVGARINPKGKFEGIQRFKSRFGSTMKEGYLWKIPIKPFKYKLFRFVTWLYYKLKRKNYLGDIIDQELKNV
jgi:lipid II:glycine glycyltransferase (peptidoglycan interpeptide bridge formation enzyme)